MSRAGRLLRLSLGCLLLGSQLLLFAAAAAAAEEITTAGPLTRVIISDTLGCQVAHRDDDEFEFYPSGSTEGNCGTFLALADAVYGPAGGPAASASWTPVSQTRTGNSVVTVVESTPPGVRVQQTDTYSPGSQSYRTEIVVSNATAAPLAGVLYRAGDCFLQGRDSGFVRIDSSSGGIAPACIVDPAEGRRIEQWLPVTPGSHYYAGFYSQVWALISGRQNFPDTCECGATSSFDNGAGISWSVNLAPGQSASFVHDTFFSPTGRGPATGPLGESVPDPTQITLDPVVVVQSVAITAGVILLVPFPSALFNSTLEENYAEVMGWVTAARRRLRAVWSAVVARVRAAIAARQASAPAPPPGVPMSPPGGPLGGPLPVATPGPLPVATPGPEPHLTPGAAPRDVWQTPLGILGFVLLSALFYAFLDPTFGFSIGSIATFLGLTLGLLVILVAYGAPLIILSRNQRVGLTVRALPATLLVAIGCVIVSRISDFQPGYLYGLIVGFFFAHGVNRQVEGRAEAAAAGSSLAAAFIAWVALALLRGGLAPGDELVGPMLSAATVTIVVAGLENAVFAMLPLRFLPGAAVYAWNRRVWIVLLALGVFGFAHVLLNPAAGAGYLADTTRTSFATLVVLLVGFGLASLLFWAWFRFRPVRAAVPPQPPGGLS